MRGHLQIQASNTEHL